MVNSHKVILIVDDNPEDRHTYKRYLKQEFTCTYKIVEAETGEEGLKLFLRENPDLILLDFLLPGMDGLELIEELKSSYTSKSHNNIPNFTYDRLPPIVMLTGEGSEAIAIQAMKAGVKDYLIKGKTNAESFRFAVRNVLEQERLHKLAERNDRRFRVSVDNMLDCFGIYTSDRERDGQIVGFRTDYINEAACKNNLFAQQSSEGTICQLTSFQPEAELFNLCCQVVETGRAISQEYSLNIPFQESASLTQDFEIRINQLEDGFVAVWRDITERKQIKKALEKSEENFRVLVTQAPIGIFKTDCRGDCQYVNPRWQAITGLSFAEAMGKGWSNALHPDDRSRVYHEWYEAAQNEREFVLEYRFKSPEGKVTWVSGRAVEIYDDSGKLDGYFGTIVDITERKHSETLLKNRREELISINQNLQDTTALLKQRNQELDEFTRIVSHDLKAPLRAISNLSVWIEEDLGDKLDDDTRKNLELLRNRVSRMKTFIESLLYYARVGKEQAPIETVIVKDLLVDIVDSVAAPPTLRVVIDDFMPVINTRKIFLQQVFTNLIGNAINHHHTKTGKIFISASEDEKFWYFSVTDDGPGIATEHYQRIFEIFQTLSSKDRVESTGIGLSIVKKIVESQGGIVGLDSQIGKGTTFRFSWLK